MTPKQKNTKVKLPSTTFAYYIKLYCNRKRSIKTKYDNNLIEATKSWLSLTESEKQKFHAKFKECIDKNKTSIFCQLKNAEPFMKVKPTSFKEVDCSIDNNTSTNKEYDEDIQNITTVTVEQTEQIETNEQQTFSNEQAHPPTPQELQDHQDEQDDNEIEAIENDDNCQKTVLIEPSPPTIKTGQDFFLMLNPPNGTNNITWASLTQLEKKQYSRAISIIKKDYISKYREYLESLTNEELFHCYNKTIV